VGRPWMFDGKMLRGDTGTPMRRIARANSSFALAEPEPFTFANLTTKSLTASMRLAMASRVPNLSAGGNRRGREGRGGEALIEGASGASDLPTRRPRGQGRDLREQRHQLLIREFLCVLGVICV